MAPTPGKSPRKNPKQRAAGYRTYGSSPVLAVGEKPLDLSGKDFSLAQDAEVFQNFGDAEQPHDHGGYADAVGKLQYTESKARRGCDRVQADASQNDAEDRHHQSFGHGFSREISHHGQPHDHEREIFRRAEFEREFGERRREQDKTEDTDGAGDERTKRGYPKRGARPALTGHLITVEAGDDGRCLTGDIQQDGGGRAAIHGAIANSGEHNNSGDWIERESGRQEQSDGRCRTDTGKDADERSHSDANETVEKVLRL